ncbi:hypothetical protein ACFXJO_37140 [Streptomyces lavendulae]|uniref:hypothetical protein n=1 Tax=Streptomyces lavendulae TaxID=1914 RepID=UPI00368DE5D3
MTKHDAPTARTAPKGSHHDWLTLTEVSTGDRPGGDGRMCICMAVARSAPAVRVTRAQARNGMILAPGAC